ncbi:hypothetical protein FAM09_28860 [Niastella caeni]|uniref:Uncharacterized protein n=1 Tax=Niastella caeni TaxID=2569763 RepID=A0A4S8H8Y5_9BACT|nr:hypothetical protein [Niastella caeni]THU31097.1 hypothetical protein FAM09_28860 [Niastella caeni]
MLNRRGIYDIEVQERVTKNAAGEYLYQVFVCSKETVYKMEYKEPETERFPFQRLVKVLNLILIKKQVKERFVEMAATEPTVRFGFFEPAKLKPFLNKYQVGCYALKKGDEFGMLK